MLPQQAIAADGVLTLDVPRKRLRVGFDHPLVHQILTAPLFQPQPCLPVDLIGSQRHAVLLPCGKVVGGFGHIRALQSRALRQVHGFQLRRFQVGNIVAHDPHGLALLHFFCRRQGLPSGADAPAAPVCTILCHGPHLQSDQAGGNPPFEPHFLRTLPHARCPFEKLQRFNPPLGLQCIVSCAIIST